MQVRESARRRKRWTCEWRADENDRMNSAAASGGLGELLRAEPLVAEGGEKDAVRKYYGETLENSDDLKTTACLTPYAPHKIIKEALKAVPDEVKAKYYGCGSPTPLGIEGLNVLDLGSGSGRDCYVASALVGPNGNVTGVDMTDQQLEVANKYVDEYCTKTLGYDKPNMKFVKGEIEDLMAAGIQDNSMDLVISNCVVNLSPDKEAVLKEVYRVLATGGEFYFSDVYCDRRLPEHVRRHEVLLGECLAGALYIEDFKRMCQKVGFTDPRVLTGHIIDVKDKDLKEVVGEATFYSITYRLFKLPKHLETLCEDYGQVATYKGTLQGAAHAYELDDHHKFVTGKPMLVCGNTAAMVGEDGLSWLSQHFEVMGDRSKHFGLFDGCGGPVSSTQGMEVGGGCC